MKWLPLGQSVSPVTHCLLQALVKLYSVLYIFLSSPENHDWRLRGYIYLRIII
jgi:hypothetical protein